MRNGQPDSNSDQLTIKQVAKIHQVSRWTVSRWIASRQLGAIKVRGRIRIPPEAYADFLRRNTEKPN